jgi:ferredoxin
MHVAADAAKCVASGQCALIAPEVFDQREDDGKVVLRIDSPAPAHHAAIREAVLVCPSRAISTADDS